MMWQKVWCLFIHFETGHEIPLRNDVSSTVHNFMEIEAVLMRNAF